MTTLKPLYEYVAIVTKIVDGDTIDVRLDLGIRVYKEIRVRLAGINAPEMKGDQREEGVKSKFKLLELLPEGTEVRVKTFVDRLDPFGRYVANVWSDASPKNVNTLLVEQGFAVNVKY